MRVALPLVALVVLTACQGIDQAAAPAAQVVVNLDGADLTVRRTRYFRPLGVAPVLSDGTSAPRTPAHEGPDGDPAVAIAGLPLAPESWDRAERAAALACGGDLIALGYDPDLGAVRPEGSDEIFLQLPLCPALDG